MDDNNLANTGDQAPQGTDATNKDSNQDSHTSQQEEKFTKRERLEFAKRKIEEQLAGIVAEDDDNTPLTKGEFKKLQQQEVRKSSLELAESITDADEKQEVIELLKTRIVPSDNPQSDLELARATVNAKKAQMIAEEMARKQNPSTSGNRPANPGHTEEQFTPTDQEAYFMKAFGMSKEDILQARKAAENAR